MDTFLNGEPLHSKDLLNLALYSYSVFTSFRISNSSVLAVQFHLDRLERDAKFLFKCGIDRKAILQQLQRFAEDNDNCVCRITLFSRNVSPLSKTRVDSLDVLLSRRDLQYPDEFLVLPVDFKRYGASHKLGFFHHLHLKQELVSEGFNDLIFLDGDQILEGSGWNVFFLKAKELITPELRDNILPGIVRAVLLNNSNSIKLEASESIVTLADLPKYEAAFATNSSFYCAPITRIGETQFSGSKTICQKIDQLLKSLEEKIFN